MNIGDLHVCCLERVGDYLRAVQPTNVFSFLDPSMPSASWPNLTGSTIRHFKYPCFDQESGHFVRGIDAAVAQFIRDLSSLEEGAGSRTLFHCHAGVSRSPAACYIAAAVSLGEGKEREAFEMMLASARKPWPNRRMIETADGILNRGGRLVAMVAAYHEINTRLLPAYRRLNRMRGLLSPVLRNE